MCTCRRSLARLLVRLCTLDDALDVVLLLPSLLAVAPPHRSLVVALETEVFAGFAQRFALVTLLPPKTAGETT